MAKLDTYVLKGIKYLSAYFRLKRILNKTIIQWTQDSQIYRSNQKIIFSKKSFLKNNKKLIDYA